MNLLIKNGYVIDPKNNLEGKKDILILNGKIVEVGNDLDCNKFNKKIEEIDAENLIVAPGFIDMHAHLREPGQEAKEDFISGSKAAAAGGFTTVCTMPNTNPVIDNGILVHGLKKRIEDVALVNIEIIGAVTKEQKGKELAHLGEMLDAGVICFSDDGHFTKNAKIMQNALDYLKRYKIPIMTHAEEPTLVEDGVMNEGYKSNLLGVKGRPKIAEDMAVMREILLAKYTGGYSHIAHISSKDAINMIRGAKQEGINITTEVTPHHLILTEDIVDLADSSSKVNPPLRTKEDNVAALEGLLDDTIDIITTDHAPHCSYEKDREYKYAPSGFPGFETALGALLTNLYHENKISLSKLIEKMSTTPGKLFFNGKRGNFDKGANGDIVIFDKDEVWQVKEENFFTKGSYSPFKNMIFKGKVKYTIVNGKIIYKNNEIV